MKPVRPEPQCVIQPLRQSRRNSHDPGTVAREIRRLSIEQPRYRGAVLHNGRDETGRCGWSTGRTWSDSRIVPPPRGMSPSRAHFASATGRETACANSKGVRRIARPPHHFFPDGAFLTSKKSKSVEVAAVKAGFGRAASCRPKRMPSAMSRSNAPRRRRSSETRNDMPSNMRHTGNADPIFRQ